MGTVWSGTDELLHRSVAVKELKLAPDLPDDEAAELRERAVREARAMAVVTHPNVVMLYDVAWDGTSPFMVMELVAGQSLAKILDGHGRLDVPLLALVVDGVAAALQAAHRLDIVHRDVKPGNVLVSRHGEIKLSDFGIARNSADPTLTRTGYVLGTPAFLAPEIAVGERVTPSADLWSLGTTLFRAAEGRLPYDNADPLVILSMIINGKVPQHHQTGPIGEVISGLMVKDPARRMPLEEVRRLMHPLLREAGTNPFDRLLDPNAPAMRNGADSATRRLSRAAGVSQSQPGGQHTPASPPTTPLVNKATARRLRLIIGVVVAVILSVAGYLIVDNMGDKQEPGQGQKPVRGVPPASRDAFSVIEAEDYSRAFPGDVKTTDLKDPVNGHDFRALGPVGFGGSPTFLYQKVDFGPAPPRQFYVSSGSHAGVDPNVKIELRLDDPRSQPIGTTPIIIVGPPEYFVIKTVVMPPVTGTHDVYLTLAPEDGNPYGPTGTKDLVYLDWFRFEL
ncbi:protein kinase [Kibdelosporangium aridum]|uniref:mitogen-activated protein kinase kinase n=2 Tax=Kibdelosporangium aridum TaxID=2030 RepID=A0A428YK53_KIBAR|nr:protein kinase [Kibdelosporangium aridum]